MVVEFRINYFRLVLPLGLFNIGAPLIIRDNTISVSQWLLFALLVDTIFGLVWFFSSPLVWVHIDRDSNVLAYQLPFKKTVTVKLSDAKSQITTRRGGGQQFSKGSLNLYVHKQKVASAQIPIWPADELRELNQMING
jgi:hypothetical protein